MSKKPPELLDAVLILCQALTLRLEHRYVGGGEWCVQNYGAVTGCP